MRSVTCDGCRKPLVKTNEYATTNFDSVMGQRLDLCFAKCYQIYEDMVAEDKALRDDMARIYKERKEQLLRKYLPRFPGIVSDKDWNGAAETTNTL